MQSIKHHLLSPWRRLLAALVFSTLMGVLLLVIRTLSGGSFRYWFLLWNLFLAWLPLGFALWLRWLTGRERLYSITGLALFALWLAFLPNSFYLLTDFSHLHNTGEASILYDVVLFGAFAWNGYVLGFISLVLVHFELLKRLKRSVAHAVVGICLLLCSFAIYLGHYQRWNTWDIVVNPAGLLFDVSDRIINPVAHTDTFVMTLAFFILLGGMYVVIWQIAQLLREFPAGIKR
jgi:uncharacterized membrane protein